MIARNKAFTLIELLIVIAIVGILASIVLISLNGAKLKAKQARTSLELKQMSTFIKAAQAENGRLLRLITGSGCTECACRDGVDMTTVPTSHLCYSRWETARAAIATEVGQDPQTFDDPVTDPWGSPYGLDENEGEDLSDPCRPDTLKSFGPDGVYGTIDDIYVNIPFSEYYDCA